MAYCVKCGERVEDTAVTCPACGAVIPKPEPAGQGSRYTYTGSTQTQNGGYAYGNTESGAGGKNTYNSYYEVQTREGYFSEAEVRSNKAMAVLCYIGVLVFIPILAGDRESEYLKLHKNQGLILFVMDAFLDILEKGWSWSAGLFSWFTGGLFGNVCDIARVVILILWIMGIVRACRGVRDELPGIGKIKIFK